MEIGIDAGSTLPPRSAVDARLWWCAFAAVAALLLLPLFATEIPPLLDYPNHLARMTILADSGRDPVLSRFYSIHWQIVPNIGIDIAMPQLMRIMPLYAAGKIVVALALLLPLAGVAALNRAIFGVRSYWPLAAGLVAFNRLFFTGFLNFLIGVGLALLAAALWERQRNGSPVWRLVAAVVAGLLIFFCHLIAVAFYGLLLLALECGAAWRLKRIDPKAFLALAIPFAVPILLFLHAPISGGGEASVGLVDAVKHYYWALANEPHGLKLYGLFGPLLTYYRSIDIAALVVILAMLIGSAAAKRLCVAPALAGAALFLLLLYPVTPFFLLQTAWVDQRLPILIGSLVFAGTLPAAPSRLTSRLAGAALVIILMLRSAEVYAQWSRHDVDIADFRRVIAPVQPGDRVLVVQAQRNADPEAMVNRPDSVSAMRSNDAMMHLPGLLVIERKAFWPLLFTAATKQPVQVNPPYDAISLPEGELPWVGGLAAPRPDDLRWAPYLAGWEGKFDWVLVLWPEEVPDGYSLLPDRLALAAKGQVAALYRIRR
jgi:hypothetical protein